ncbi:MAG: hypothetical protein ACOC39_02975 [Desulfovermiculus sp.]
MSSPGLTADLHVHSRYSRRPAQWILQKIDCPECFSDPRRIYALAQDRGMDLVTITDQGGPQENLIPKQTGLIVPALNVQALVQAILTLADDPQRLEKMKIQARQYMQERSTQEAFVQSWEMYEDKAQNIEGRTIFQAHTKFHQIVTHES